MCKADASWKRDKTIIVTPFCTPVGCVQSWRSWISKNGNISSALFLTMASRSIDLNWSFFVKRNVPWDMFWTRKKAQNVSGIPENFAVFNFFFHVFSTFRYDWFKKQWPFYNNEWTEHWILLFFVGQSENAYNCTSCYMVSTKPSWSGAVIVLKNHGF